MKTKMCFAAAVFLCMASMSGPVQADNRHLQINCTVHSPYEAFFMEIVKIVSRKNGVDLQHETPPVGRSLVLANQGVSDGDGPRIKGISSQYPNLVRVPEPFGSFHFGAFTRDPDLVISSWESLSDLNVAYIHGWKIFDNHVTAARSIVRVNDKETLFSLLDAGRADVVLITRLAGYEMIDKMGLEEIRFVEPPLSVEPNFLYLHKKNRDLTVPFARTLRELKKDGTYDRIYEEMIVSDFPGAAK